MSAASRPGIGALPRAALDAHTASTSLERLGFAGLEALCRASAAEHAPDRALGHDPRGNLPIAYSEARRRRLAVGGCVVCEGQTCPAADVAPLPGDDCAWLTPNFYPVAYPFPVRGAEASLAADAAHAVDSSAAEPPSSPVLHGLHLVQWSSLRHDGGLIGADAATAAAIFAQLARAEEWLLHHADAQYPESGEGHRGFVGLIKNRGRTVGGSVEHDHQQVLLGNLPFAEPPATRGLRAALLAHAVPELEVERLDGVRTLVPAFMRRPLHAFLVPEGGDVGWLHHLPPARRDALALAVARLSLAVSALMAGSGREPAWNLIVHTGAGCGPLLELRPYTQPLGGYEHLGLYICEEQPATSAGRLRDALSG